MDLEKKSKSNKEGSCGGEAGTIEEDRRRRSAGVDVMKLLSASKKGV
jgi:hypothetical protein